MSIKISFSDIEKVIAEQLGVDSYFDRKRLSSRLKQLRSFGNIPKAAGSNRGPRARYELADIVQLGLVFECVQRSVATLRAALAVTTYRDILERSVATAWMGRDTAQHDAMFALFFLEDLDGFTKRDTILEWVNFQTARRQAGSGVVPLVVTGRGSELFPINATDRFPSDVELPAQEGATLIHLTTFVKNLVRRLEQHAVCKEHEFTSYCEDVMARPDPQRDSSDS